MELSIVRNSGSNLPLKKGESTVYPDAPLSEVHEDARQQLRDDLDQTVLADELGVDYAFFTEHHFNQAAAEQSPLPMEFCIAAAMVTEDIKLGQLGNVLVTRDPIRLAEQAAMLDVVSDGRGQVGIVRGYAPREVDVLGQHFEGTVQDQEKNRRVFEEKYEILLRAMTEESFNYYGDFHTIPPKHTKWHHRQTRDYFADDVTEQDVDDVLEWREGEEYRMEHERPAVAGGSTLKELSVLPQPVQDPHPPIWQPMTSPRTIEWAVRRGHNGALLAYPPELCKEVIDFYHEVAKEAGWPHRLEEYDGEPFRKGWDEEKESGIIYSMYLFNTDVHDEETLGRWKLGIEHIFSHYVQFGFHSMYEEYYDGDISEFESQNVFPADIVIDAGSAFVGDTEELVDQILGIAEMMEYEDFHFSGWFDVAGLTPEEENEQLEHFVENVYPHLEEEYPSPRATAAD